MALSFDPRAVLTPGGIGQGVGNMLGALAGVPLQYQQAQAAKAAQAAAQTKQQFDMDMAMNQDRRAESSANQNAAQIGQNIEQSAAEFPLKTAGMQAHNALTTAQTAGELTAEQKMQSEQTKAAGASRYRITGDPLGRSVTILDTQTGQVQVVPIRGEGAPTASIGNQAAGAMGAPAPAPAGPAAPHPAAVSTELPPTGPTPAMIGAQRDARIQQLTAKIQAGDDPQAEAELELLLAPK